jgi:hypothetical protein
MSDVDLDKLEVMLKAAFIKKAVDKARAPLTNEVTDLLYKYAGCIVDSTNIETDEARYRFEKDVVFELAEVVYDYTGRLVE